MRRAVCSGSFDPVTRGHIDIFERASTMFDELIISVFYNPTKDKSMFSMEERVEMIKQSCPRWPFGSVPAQCSQLSHGVSTGSRAQ